MFYPPQPLPLFIYSLFSSFPSSYLYFKFILIFMYLIFLFHIFLSFSFLFFFLLIVLFTFTPFLPNSLHFPLHSFYLSPLIPFSLLFSSFPVLLLSYFTHTIFPPPSSFSFHPPPIYILIINFLSI